MREGVRKGGSVFFERFSLPPDAWSGTITAHPTGRTPMAANPIKQKLLGDIEQAGGWEKVFERVASGESQTAIAASLGVSQGFFSRVIHLDAERVRAFREAKRLWAITLVERTADLVNNVKENRDSIAKVREVAAHARWEAGKWDRLIRRRKAPTPNAIASRHVSVRAAGQRACTARRARIHAAPGSGRSRRSKTCGTEPARLSRVPFGRCPPRTALPPPR